MHPDILRLQPVEPEHHFAAIAALMSTQETEPSTAKTLAEWYNKQLEDGIWFWVAVSPADEVLGFSGLYHSSLTRQNYYSLYVIVAEKWRGCGLGSLLYAQVFDHAQTVGVQTLNTRVRDTYDDGLQFATRRGFIVKKHSVEMMFDLKSWDEQRYEPILKSLKEQGFMFTNMAELGDTQEARRKLYALNNNAAATDPGSDGIPPWASFEEFDKDVCNSSWYHPDGQIVAIDTRTGEWAAMSAITVFEGADHAYNLFTVTYVRYRWR